MNYNSLMNKPTINYKELIGDNTVNEVGGITEEQFNTLLNTDLSSYYTKAQIDDLFSRSYVYREKSGSIVTFDCPASVNGIDTVVSEIVAVQSGTGDPSPANVRPISGWSAVNVVVSPTTDAEDGTTYTTALKDEQGNPMTCYGGTLSNENGVQRLENAKNMVDLGTLNWGKSSLEATILFIAILDKKEMSPMICSKYKYVRDKGFGLDFGTISDSSSSSYTNYIFVRNQDFSGKTATECASILNGTQLVYELATPQQIPQDSLSIATQKGTNNLWADSGDITVKALDKIIQG